MFWSISTLKSSEIAEDDELFSGVIGFITFLVLGLGLGFFGLIGFIGGLLGFIGDIGSIGGLTDFIGDIGSIGGLLGFIGDIGSSLGGWQIL